MRHRLLLVPACLLLLAGCQDSASPTTPFEGGGFDWHRTGEPVPSEGLSFAVGSQVHLADGSVIELGRTPSAFVVAGDGVFFQPDDSADLWFAGREGEAEETGLTLAPETLGASPDGRYLVGLDSASGHEDANGDVQRQVVVADLEEGDTWSSTDGMGDLDDDLGSLYPELEMEIAHVSDTTVRVDGEGTWDFDLASGLSERVGGDALRAKDLTSPAGTWRVVEKPGVADPVEGVDGTVVVPRTGGRRWSWSQWLDDSTLVGFVWDGPGEGLEFDPEKNRSSLMTCTFPSGECTRVPDVDGESVLLPRPTRGFLAEG